jgi:hypothetical protein
MPSLAISAVDNATEKLTIVGHGQVTGAGPAALRRITAGAVPTGYAELTDYWLIVIDADHVQLADSSAHALANVPVPISDNGTASLVLEIGIPYRRAVTHVAGVSQVKASTLNALEDTFKALWAFFTGQAQAVFTSITLAANQDITISGTAKYKRGSQVRHIPVAAGRQWSGTAMLNDVTYDKVTTTAANNVYRIPIMLNEGERLLRVKCRANDAGSDVLSMKVYKTDWSGAISRTQLGATASSTGSSGADETLDSGAIAEVAGGATYCTYFAEFTCTYSAGCNFGGLDVTTDVP